MRALFEPPAHARQQEFRSRRRPPQRQGLRPRRPHSAL